MIQLLVAASTQQARIDDIERAAEMVVLITCRNSTRNDMNVKERRRKLWQIHIYVLCGCLLELQYKSFRKNT
jgi:hypothetical protein